jgi:type VI secretion system protein VasG
MRTLRGHEVIVPDIRRETLFGKLNPIAYQTIESATLFCKLRGNPYVELAHWVHQILEAGDSDWRRIVEAFDIDAARLASDLTRALERLPRGSSSVQDLSLHIDRAVERAWLYASLSFQETAIRTGHVLLAALKTPELYQTLRGISTQFDAISHDALSRRWPEILGRAPEAKHVQAAAVSDSAPAAAAVLGKQEALRRFAVDLTERARRGEIDPVVGRDPEMRQMIDVLMRRRQNNPLLTGEAGVGKTAVVEGLALRIARGDVPEPLRDVALHALDVGLLSAGASMKGEFEQRLRHVIEDVQASPKPIILFIDEAHTLIGAGGAAGTGDAANLLKPALARGTLRTIAATTWAEYKRHIEKDPALTRRFEVVQVAEPSEALALRMLRGVVDKLEAHHRVQVLDDALEAAVKLSHRYIPARQLPDKAVSLLDTACARVAIAQQARPPALEDAQRNLEAWAVESEIIEREASVGIEVSARRARVRVDIAQESARLRTLEERFAAEQALVQQILSLRAELRRATDTERLAELTALQDQLTSLQGDSPLLTAAVDSQAVSAVVSDWTGIPTGRMVRNELQAVLRLAERLSERVLGQPHALDMISRRMQVTRAGLEDPRKPLGVFLLAGPSGVGKTETALALSEALFGGEHSVITINMSEFQESHTVSTLKGAPPGYVGYGEGGVLTEAVRRTPYSVILLDEVEKAHPDVHELFFQVFDKGFMEDGEGRVIDFKNTLILLTTNAGSELIMHSCRDQTALPAASDLAAALRGPLLEVFPPALLGRMTVVPYYPLTDSLIREIIQLQLARIANRLHTQHDVPLHYSDEVPELIAKRCIELESGARMIEAQLAQSLLPQLSEALLHRLLSGQPLQRVDVSVQAGELSYAFA